MSKRNDERHSRSSAARELYQRHLAVPVTHATLTTVVFTPLLTLATWSGWQERPKHWGDPIPFSEALSQAPEIAAYLFFMTLVISVILRR